MEFMFGLCHPGENLEYFKEAGIGWIRADIPWPFNEFGNGYTELFLKVADEIKLYREKGFKILGITPFPGFPCEFEPGTIKYFEYYRNSCQHIAKYFVNDITYWQICNEPNIAPFRRGLDLEKMYVLMEYGAEGVKNGNRNAFVGINPAYQEDIIWNMLERMYIKGRVNFDYIGIDGYPGSWEEGGPETWKEYIDKISRFINKPIIVAEFGYSSEGKLLTEHELYCEEDFENVKKLMKKMGFYEKRLEKDEQSVKKGIFLYKLHHYKKWAFGWKNGHSQDEQASYLKESFKIFTNHHNVIGAFWYCGNDTESCFWCKRKGCPCETAWGLFDLDCAPKKSYFAYKEVIESYKEFKR